MAAGLYYAVTLAFIAWAVFNVASGVWPSAHAATSSTPCARELSTLGDALERAEKRSADRAQQGGAQSAAEFRGALLPEWSRLPVASSICKNDRRLAAALDALERLRYALERAILRDEVELTPLRLQVESARATLLRDPSVTPPLSP